MRPHTLTYEMADVDAVLVSGWEATRQDLNLGHFKLGKRAGAYTPGVWMRSCSTATTC